MRKAGNMGTIFLKFDDFVFQNVRLALLVVMSWLAGCGDQSVNAAYHSRSETNHFAIDQDQKQSQSTKKETPTSKVSVIEINCFSNEDQDLMPRFKDVSWSETPVTWQTIYTSEHKNIESILRELNARIETLQTYKPEEKIV